MKTARCPRLCLLPTLLATVTSGCSLIGPSSIAQGRHVYNEVINRTEDEQILTMIVRERYDETFGLLAVASVTANISASARATSNIGFGPSENYRGNLVPLAVGFAYEENPTISYVPLSGEEFMQRVMGPITLEQTLLATRGTARDRLKMFRFLMRRINGLSNPISSSKPPPQKLKRLLAALAALHQEDVVDIAVGDKGDGYFVVIHDYSEKLQASVREVLEVLGLKNFTVDGSAILIPLRMSIGRRDPNAIEIQTRSVMELIQGVGAAIDVPEVHLESGVVNPSTWRRGEEWQFIDIRTSPDRPDNATVAILHRGYWFYIDATDSRSKRSFILLKTLIGMRMESAGVKQRPVLTIGVGK